MTDQESASIVFDDQLSEAEDADLEEFSNFADRLYDFEVSKTNEQAEAVDLREGFEVRKSLNALSGRISLIYLPKINLPPSLVEAASKSPDAEQSGLWDTPRLVAGETSQAVMFSQQIPASTRTRPIFNELFTPIRLQDFLCGRHT